MPPVQRLDDLLGGQRDEHADDDDSDLARELAPAVQRLWKMEMHSRAPGGYASVTEGLMSAMGRKLPLGCTRSVPQRVRDSGVNHGIGNRSRIRAGENRSVPQRR